IPMAVLFDGKQHLIEQYAIATTPSLSLTSATKLNRAGIDIMASGLTQSVQGFSELPAVNKELSNIDKIYTALFYKDDKFLVKTVSQEISQGRYSIVHVATHGEFNQDYKKSFLLAYDGKITMNTLENTIGLRRYLNSPLELLVLSACQTAAGDDRAALGLAGVAIKSGARSALATLWFINDAATVELVTDFYKNLQHSELSKAQALQQAQLVLLRNKQTAHPAFWAPFLLIGNWL
ncbi:MAG: CHAT domain-containing protein, partial [Gammaproteobacteria bacterium]|nr:CHAT domain-containing protein [Gammaproteobacteria bacterium]